MSGGRGAAKPPLSYEGDYDATRTYLPREVVRYSGTAYLAIAKVTGVLPTVTASWIPLGGGAGGPRPASLVVAAVDSSAACKASADVVCTGTDDSTPIQAAYDALTGPTSVLLLPGNYVFHYNYAFSLTRDYSTLSCPGAIITADRQGLIAQGNECGIRDVTIKAVSLHGDQLLAVALQGAGCYAHGVSAIGNVGGDLGQAFYGRGAGSRFLNCYASAAYIGFTLTNGHGSVVSGCVGSGNVVGVAVQGTDTADCVVAGNTLLGASVAGSTGAGVYLDRGTAVRTNVTGNTITGHDIGIDDGACESLIVGNIIRDSLNQGIDSYGTDSKVSDNIVTGSSQAATNTSSNIRVTATRTSVTGNTCRKQTSNAAGTSSGNSAEYGLEIVAGAVDVFVSHNDLKNGGATAAYADAGTGTVTGGANRT